MKKVGSLVAGYQLNIQSSNETFSAGWRPKCPLGPADVENSTLVHSKRLQYFLKAYLTGIPRPGFRLRSSDVIPGRAGTAPGRVGPVPGLVGTAPGLEPGAPGFAAAFL